MRFRNWAAGLLAVLCGFTALSLAGHAQAASTIRIYLDGKWIQSDVAPYIMPKANLTMVPVRVISQGLGASVVWTQKTKTVTIRKSGTTIVMKVGQKTATVGGVKTALDAPVALTNNRVTVPLRFISERLGLQVKWNPTTQWIQLMTKPGQEIKGAWISTVYNLDWPSVASYGSPDTQKQEYSALLDDLQGMGMNAVYVQVRPNADALYPSKLAPWTKYLTGVQGQDPGYDPLAYLIEETHRRGMEFHAWFNPFRANTDATLTGLSPQHVAVLHPDWIVNAGGKLYVNPGIPAARQHIIDVIMEVVKNYPIDGVHLDDYFYPSGSNFDDDAAFLAYNAKKFADKDDWRRDNVNDFVKKLGQTIHAAKPQLSFGISPFGVWRNQSEDASGSDTHASVTAYDDMHADVRSWIRGNWVDYVMPQLYWSIGYPAAGYDKLVQWWAHEVDGSNVKLFIGHSPYKLGTSEAGWQTSAEIVNQLKFNETYPQVRGDVFFSAKDLRRNPLDVISALKAYYQIK